jgi:hypothetical protein
MFRGIMNSLVIIATSLAFAFLIHIFRTENRKDNELKHIMDQSDCKIHCRHKSIQDLEDAIRLNTIMYNYYFGGKTISEQDKIFISNDERNKYLDGLAEQSTKNSEGRDGKGN